MNYLENTSHIGDIGEAVAIAEFMKVGFIPLKPMSDNLPYDLVVDNKGQLLKIQVKTTQSIKESKMDFYTERKNSFSYQRTQYLENEVDYIFLYCLENEFKGLISIQEVTSGKTTIRLEKPKNNQVQGVKMAKDYLFKDKIQQLK